MPCKHFRSLSGTGPRVPGRWTGSSDSIRFHNASSISHGFAMTVQRANPKPRTAQPVRAPTNLKRVLKGSLREPGAGLEAVTPLHRYELGGRPAGADPVRRVSGAAAGTLGVFGA